MPASLLQVFDRHYRREFVAFFVATSSSQYEGSEARALVNGS